VGSGRLRFFAYRSLPMGFPPSSDSAIRTTNCPKCGKPITLTTLLPKARCQCGEIVKLQNPDKTRTKTP